MSGPVEVPRLAGEGGRPDGAAPMPKARSVIDIVPRKAGISELHLACGHIVRRRLHFCPPSQVICPHCRTETPELRK